jgi:hypothetical protein
MAQYDVPGMLDYILSVTNHSKMAYVGHSQVAALCLCAEHVYDPLALTELLWYLCQGTIQMFAALAVDHTLPLNSFIGLGPVATVSMCNPHSLSQRTQREESHESVYGFASLTQLVDTIQPMKITWRCDYWPTPTLIRSSSCLASATSSPRYVLRSARLARPNKHTY